MKYTFVALLTFTLSQVSLAPIECPPDDMTGCPLGCRQTYISSWFLCCMTPADEFCCQASCRAYICETYVPWPVEEWIPCIFGEDEGVLKDYSDIGVLGPNFECEDPPGQCDLIVIDP